MGWVIEIVCGFPLNIPPSRGYTSSFCGGVVVGGQRIEYRAFMKPDGSINVGTYY